MESKDPAPKLCRASRPQAIVGVTQLRILLWRLVWCQGSPENLEHESYNSELSQYTI